MALGKRKPQQNELFIPAAKLVTGPGHPFYSKLNAVLAAAGFDEFVEQLCAPYYKEGGLSVTLKAWTVSAALPGAAPIVWACGRFWASRSRRKPRCMFR